jgi:ABC-type branched-subunit amino acid transport system permease subunit
VLIFGLFALGFNRFTDTRAPLVRACRVLRARRLRREDRAGEARLTSLWLALGLGLSAAIVGPARWWDFSACAAAASTRDADAAFAMMLYFIAFHAADLTGGDDSCAASPASAEAVRHVAVAPHAAGLLFLRVRARRPRGRRPQAHPGFPFGAVLQAIRENSDRAVACGYDINRIKLLSFVFSALFAGLAGALDALRLTVVPVDSLYWTTSGQVVIMTLLGGAGTFFGPFVGAATFLILADRLSLVIEAWPLVIGIVFMAFVLFLPRGIWGTLTARGVER